MNRMLTVCGMVVLLAAGSMAYPWGAPASVCDDEMMVPTSHIDDPKYYAAGFNNDDLPNINITSKYTLTSQQVQDNPRTFDVTLTGPDFMGFVIRANTGNGKFAVAENDVTAQTMSCTRPAVTHKTRDLKGSVTVKYEEPIDSNANPTFQATVVPDGTLYVINIKS